MNPEDIMLNEINPDTQRQILHDVTFCGSKGADVMEAEHKGDLQGPGQVTQAWECV